MKLSQSVSVAARWQAFGWRVLEVDGHDMAALVATLRHAHEDAEGRPTAVIARTVKGKGISFMEHQFGWHAKPPTDQHRIDALAELAEHMGREGGDDDRP